MEKRTPWYKEPMMLLVVGIPVIAIFWGFVMLTLAVDGADTLVSDSYYKDGVSYTENQEQDQAARDLLAEADLRFEGDRIIITLSDAMSTMPTVLQLQMGHPTIEDRDATAVLQQISEREYVGMNPLELPEKRHLWLTSPEQGWRLQQTVFIEPGKVIHLSFR
ncbi:MAG TPA: hypothetical protein DEA26_07545 [Oceanospirillales bacterium]|nr:hypothetical protein [Oceanospirillaceae bacterium]HBS42517.1 hypothetical protein [Oceanospirillales bacterium]